MESMRHSNILNGYFVLGCAVAILLVVAMVQPLSASEYGDSGATIRPDPVTIELSPGQVTTVNIELENAADVYGIDVRAKFDPALIEIVDADPAQDGIQMTPGTFLKPDFVVRNTADNGVGTLQYVVTQVNPTQPATGNGVVLTLNVRGKTSGQTELKIDSVQMADRRGQSLAVQPQNGIIRVGQPQGAATQAPPKQTVSVEPTVAASDPTPTGSTQPLPTPEARSTQAGPLPSVCGAAPVGMVLSAGIAGWLGMRRRRRDS
jgi:hypothetical protein